MSDEYYYSGSGFYEESDSNIGDTFTDVSELPCPYAGCKCLRARRYGQWWKLTGVSPDCQNHDEAHERLRKLYARVVTLNHPNVTRMVAMVATPLFAGECVVEEYIDGMPLDEFLQSSPEDALRHSLLEQVLDTLQYCHHKGVTHGRLSPAVIMVTHQDHIAKLTDFGFEGNPADDVSAMTEVVHALEPSTFQRIAEACRRGDITTIEALRRSIDRPHARRWLPLVALTALAAMVVAGAFYLGHRSVLASDAELADTLALPSIYFSDTVTSSTLLNDTAGVFVSSVTGAIVKLTCDNVTDTVSAHVAIDLGLSVLWAPFNMGSTNTDINHVGGLFTWCDTLGHGAAKHLDGCWPPDKPMCDIAGTSDDPVCRFWGNGWRMPTIDEWRELMDKCKWTLLLKRGIVPGYKVLGPNGQEIFLPMAGYQLRFRAYERGVVGYYWSGTAARHGDRRAWSMHLDTLDVKMCDTMTLNLGMSIRPVLDKGN